MKLILTHLQDISDDDAIEVARILFPSDEVEEPIKYDVVRGEEAVGVNMNDGNIELAIYGYGFAARSEVTNEYLPTIFCASAINYLRSKSYDCDSLIASGIAITK